MRLPSEIYFHPRAALDTAPTRNSYNSYYRGRMWASFTACTFNLLSNLRFDGAHGNAAPYIKNSGRIGIRPLHNIQKTSEFFRGLILF